MCKTCKEVKTLPPKQALEKIAKSRAYQKNPEHFKDVMDTLLGTEEPAQDVERDAAWERGHRS